MSGDSSRYYGMIKSRMGSCLALYTSGNNQQPYGWNCIPSEWPPAAVLMVACSSGHALCSLHMRLGPAALDGFSHACRHCCSLCVQRTTASGGA